MNSDSNCDLTQLSPLWRAPDTGPMLDVLGVTRTYKAMANDTGHQFSLWESIVPPGAGVPAHTHTREDEAFYVLSGEVLIEVEGAADPLRLGPGGFLFAPRNRRHAYRNIGTVAAHLLVFAIPGTGLDRMFAAFGRRQQTRRTHAGYRHNCCNCRAVWRRDSSPAGLGTNRARRT